MCRKENKYTDRCYKVSILQYVSDFPVIIFCTFTAYCSATYLFSADSLLVAAFFRSALVILNSQLLAIQLCIRLLCKLLTSLNEAM